MAEGRSASDLVRAVQMGQIGPGPSEVSKYAEQKTIPVSANTFAQAVTNLQQQNPDLVQPFMQTRNNVLSVMGMPGQRQPKKEESETDIAQNALGSFYSTPGNYIPDYKKLNARDQKASSMYAEDALKAEEEQKTNLDTSFNTNGDQSNSGNKEGDKKETPGSTDNNGQTGANTEYTLSGQTLAADDLAGIAASQYLSDVLNGEYGDDWGSFQLNGTYDQWRDALASEMLAPYFTDITGDERFLRDGVFDFDTYWNHVGGLNPQDFGSMAYDDWRLLNGTSAGAMNSYNNALANSGYQIYFDPNVASSFMGDVRDDGNGNMVYDNGQAIVNPEGGYFDVYGRPLNMDLESSTITGFSPEEIANILNTRAVAYNMSNGGSSDYLTEAEIEFLNDLGIARDNATGATRYVNPYAINYENLADPSYDFFNGSNPYAGAYGDINAYDALFDDSVTANKNKEYLARKNSE